VHERTGEVVERRGRPFGFDDDACAVVQHEAAEPVPPASP
jgi:hypothetical protein